MKKSLTADRAINNEIWKMGIMKEKPNIVYVIGRIVKLEQRGQEYVGLCPFHNDHNPSLRVDPAKQIYKCFVCGAGGDVYNFVIRYYGCTFLQAEKLLSNVPRTQLPSRPTKRVMNLAQTFSQLTASLDVSEYADRLGVDVRALSSYGCRIANNGNLMAPMYLMINGQIVVSGIQFRDKAGKKLAYKGGVNGLFLSRRFFSDDKASTVCITEGLSDAAALTMLLPDQVIIGRQNCTLPSHQLELVNYLCVRYSNIVIFADADEPGIRGAAELKNYIGKKSCVEILIPEAKDVREAVVSGGECRFKTSTGNVITYERDGTCQPVS